MCSFAAGDVLGSADSDSRVQEGAVNMYIFVVDPYKNSRSGGGS